MDSINELSDDLILKILSFVETKDAVTSSLLSKRWRSLWKHVGKLEYSDPSIDSEHWRASRFVDKFLLLQKAPVLEAMSLSLSRHCPTIDIETWISIAISRGVRVLYFLQYRPISRPIRLPRSLYTCETIVSLSIRQAILVDVPLTICFRSLKTLDLGAVNFSSEEIVHRLLSGCPVLEELRVIQFSDANVKNFTIPVPSLLRLTVMDFKSVSQVPGDDFRFVIKAPSLKSLKIANQFHRFCSLVKMPELVNASITLGHSDSKKLLECLTSVKHLFLCLKPPMDSFPTCVFNHLMSLKLCTCSLHWCCIILRHTPNLRVLRFEAGVSMLPNPKKLGNCCMSYEDVQTQWEQPSSVPQCMISSIETVEWTGYKGTEVEYKMVKYLLENTRQLKKMAIRSSTSIKLEEKLRNNQMLQELASTQMISTKYRFSITCR